MNIIFSDIYVVEVLQKHQDKFVFVTGRGLEMVEEMQEASKFT